MRAGSGCGPVWVGVLLAAVLVLCCVDPVESAPVPEFFARHLSGRGRDLAKVCNPGEYYIPATDTTLETCEPCSPGYYCDGVDPYPRVPCPAGRYGSGVGLTAATCTGPCSAGYFCDAGSVSETSATCGATDVYCPEATTAVLSVPAGHYGVGGVGPTTRSAVVPCEPGYFCVSGIRQACAAGSFESSPSATTCSGSCPAGSMCPTNSTAPIQCSAGRYAPEASGNCPICPEGSFCEAGVGAPTACPAGRFGNADGLETADCSAPCPAGFYCASGSVTATSSCGGGLALYCPTGTPTRLSVPPGRLGVGGADSQTSTQACPIGSYCLEGVATLCAGGQFGASTDLSDPVCDGPCLPGFFCPAGSVSDTQNACPTVDVYCPGQTAEAQPVSLGHYTTPVSEVTATGRTGQLPCEPGTWCSGGVRTNCSAGRFSSAPAQSSPCTERCTAGYICDEGSPVPNPESGACRTPTHYCPSGVTRALTTGSGNFSVAAPDGTFVSQAVCPVGHYCRDGVQRPCPAGTAGTVAGLATDGECKPCVEGYYCPAGSTSVTQHQCGGNDGFCPPRSGAVSAVAVGYYSVGGNSTTRTGEVQCAVGSFCVDGVEDVCPPGRFGDQPGLASSACSGECLVGFYCPANSTRPDVFPCTDPDVFCPAGSGAPVTVLPGLLKCDEAGPAGSDNDTVCEFTRPCPAGSWCVNGTAALCPAGRFGCSTHLKTPECNGLCAAGFYCDEGSDSVVQHKCGENITEALQANVFCPTGSSRPQPVGLGNYSIGIGSAVSERTAQVQCEPGHYCVDGWKSECPQGRYGVTAGLVTSNCTDLCTDGKECPTGTAVPTIDCREGHYCYDGLVVPCPAGRYYPFLGASSADDCIRCGNGTYNPVTGQSLPTACRTCPPLEGSYEDASVCWPGLVSVIADDLVPVEPGHSVQDVVVLNFTKPTSQPDVGTWDQLKRLVSFSPSIGSELVGEWLSGGKRLRVSIVNASGVGNDTDAYEIGQVSLTLTGAGAGLRDESLLSHVSPHVTMLLAGSWGKPSTPFVTSARALNTNGAAGLGSGDQILIEFNQRVSVSLVPVTKTEDLDALLSWSSPAFTEYSGRWVTESKLLVTLAMPGDLVVGSAEEVSTRVGVLSFDVLPSAGLLSVNLESDPANQTGVVVDTGSWGDVPSAMSVTALSARRLRVNVQPPVSYDGYVLGGYSVQVRGGPVDTTVFHAPAPGSGAAHVEFLMFDPAFALQSLEFCVRVESSDGAIVGPEWCWPTRVTPQAPAVSSVQLGTVMATQGGRQVRLSGSNFGEQGVTVTRVEFSNDRFTFVADGEDCTVTSPSQMQCANPPGVGVDFRCIVIVDDVASAPSAQTLDYQSPVVSEFRGAATTALTEGLDEIFVLGDHFGAASLSAVDLVTYSSDSMPGIVFEATDCRVVTDNVEIACLTAPGAGRNHEWSVVIAGQNSSAAVTSYGGPTITSISRLPRGPASDSRVHESHATSTDLESLSTLGGDIIQIDGTNFGPLDVFLTVVYNSTDDGFTFTAANCTLAVPHTTIRCLTVEGLGTGFHWSVNVGGQWSAPSVASTSYAAPRFDGWLADTADGKVTTSGALLSQRVQVFGFDIGNRLDQITVTVGGLETGNVNIDTPHSTVSFLMPSVDWSWATVSIAIARRVNTIRVDVRPPLVLRVDAPEAHPADLPILPTVRLLAAMEVGVDGGGGGGGDAAIGALTTTTTTTTTAATTAAARSLQTDGGGALIYLRILGESFGSGNHTSVSVGGKPCIKYVFTHQQLECVAQNRSGLVEVVRHAPPPASVPDMVAGAASLNASNPVTGEGATLWDFDANRPIITRVRCDSCLDEFAPRLPTTGGELLLMGNNFRSLPEASVATSGLVEFIQILRTLPTGQPLLDESRLLGGVSVVQWADEEIRVNVSAGQGANFGIRVTSRSIVGTQVFTEFSFMGPAPVTIDPATGPVTGTTVTIAGDNFGLSGEVTIGNKTCTTVSWTHTEIQCVAPPNVERQPVVVTVGGQVAAVTLYFTYLPPEVEAVVVPPVMPTTGGVPLEVSGTNFGSVSQLRVFLINPRNDDRFPCTVTASTATFLTCITTEGGGSNLILQVQNETPPPDAAIGSSNITDGNPAKLVSYSPPEVSFMVAASEVHPDAFPPVVGLESGALWSHRPALGRSPPPDSLPVYLYISGAHLSTTAHTTVTVSARPCDLPPVTTPYPASSSAPSFSPVSPASPASPASPLALPPFGANHTTIICEAPRAAADGSAVVNVTVYDQSVVLSDVFAYDPPLLQRVSPNNADANAATRLTVSGWNFGEVLPVGTEFNITVGNNYTCGDVLWESDRTVSCTLGSATAAFVAGFHPLVVEVHNRTSINALSVLLECHEGSYGTTGEVCIRCDDLIGAECPGYGMDPVPLPGYFRAGRAVMVLCSPAEACVGGDSNGCGEGYVGDRCSECAQQYYRLEQHCEPCPSLLWLMYSGIAVILLLLGLTAYYTNKKKVNLVGLSIGVDLLQIISMFAAFDFAWPVALERMYSSASSVNFNVEILAPECSVSWSFAQKFVVIESMPLALVGSISVIAVLVWVWPRAVRGCSRLATGTVPANGRWGSQLDVDSIHNNLLGIVFSAFYYMYFVIVRMAMNVFDCVTNANGVSALDSDPSVLCDEKGGVREKLYPFAVLAMVVYGVGLPAAFGSVLWSYRRQIKADQTLKAKREGADPDSNPNYWVRARFRKLYEDFRPQTSGWRMLLLLRKFLLAWATIMFNQNAMFQASFSAFVLFAAYVLHVKYRPFLSSDLVPTKLSALLAAQVAKNKKTKTRTKQVIIGADGKKRGVGTRRSMRKSVVVMSLLATKKTVSFVFDYNTLESAFLCSAMGILLAGMMFESSAFKIGSTEYIILTAVVITMICGSLLLFLGIMGFEVYRALQFAGVHRRAEQKTKQHQEAKERREKEKARLRAANGRKPHSPDRPLLQTHRAAAIRGLTRVPDAKANPLHDSSTFVVETNPLHTPSGDGMRAMLSSVTNPSRLPTTRNLYEPSVAGGTRNQLRTPPPPPRSPSVSGASRGGEDGGAGTGLVKRIMASSRRPPPPPRSPSVSRSSGGGGGGRSGGRSGGRGGHGSAPPPPPRSPSVSRSFSTANSKRSPRGPPPRSPSVSSPPSARMASRSSTLPAAATATATAAAAAATPRVVAERRSRPKPFLDPLVVDDDFDVSFDDFGHHGDGGSSDDSSGGFDDSPPPPPPPMQVRRPSGPPPSDDSASNISVPTYVVTPPPPIVVRRPTLPPPPEDPSTPPAPVWPGSSPSSSVFSGSEGGGGSVSPSSRRIVVPGAGGVRDVTSADGSRPASDLSAFNRMARIRALRGATGGNSPSTRQRRTSTKPKNALPVSKNARRKASVVASNW